MRDFRSTCLWPAAFVVAGAATSVQAAGFKRIKTAADFKAKIVGKTLSVGKSTFIVQPDGSLTGSTPTGKVVGKWNWQQGFYCRALRIGKKNFPSDCQLVRFNGDEVVFVRQQGKGDSSPAMTVK